MTTSHDNPPAGVPNRVEAVDFDIFGGEPAAVVHDIEDHENTVARDAGLDFDIAGGDKPGESAFDLDFDEPPPLAARVPTTATSDEAASTAGTENAGAGRKVLAIIVIVGLLLAAWWFMR